MAEGQGAVPTQGEIREQFVAQAEQARQRAEADAAARQERARAFIEGLSSDTDGQRLE